MFFLYVKNIYYSIKILFSKDRGLYDDVRNLIGVYPNNLSLYKCAFTHRSVMKKEICLQHNERLEYLGDAVLGSVVADYLYKNFPCSNEGSLTKMRAKLVNRTTLNKVAKHHRMERLLISQINLQTEGKFIYSNMVEAFVGAAYLDLGYRFTKRFILKKLLKEFLTVDLNEIEYDFKSRVLEWGQKGKHVIDFVSDFDPSAGVSVFASNILINGEIAGTGTGRSKKEAEQNAAKSIWDKWER